MPHQQLMSQRFGALATIAQSRQGVCCQGKYGKIRKNEKIAQVREKSGKFIFTQSDT